MPSKHDWESANAVQYLQAVFDSPVLLHVRTRIYIHGKAPLGSTPCPCCGSTKAMVIEERDDLELLLDRVTGERRLKTEVQDKAGFDALAKTARPVLIPLRCHPRQLPLILDTKSKILGAFGGNRSGKTTSGVYWLVRQWMLKGGKGAKFWWVAPSRAQTLVGVEKLVTGEVSDRAQPPAFPLDPITDFPLLVVRWPESEGARKQKIVMVDGSIIELHHASKPTADNLKGKSVRAIMVDEGCAIIHRANWTVLVMRLADSGGQLFCASTPKGGHWLKEEIVENRSEHITHTSLSIRENPWQSDRDVEDQISLCKDENQVKREIDGLWIGDQGNLWIYFDPRVHTYDDPSFNLPRGRQDVTAQAIRGFWRPGGNPYQRTMLPQNTQFVGGQDFNFNPMTTVVCKIFGDPSKPETWGVCVVDEVQQWDSDADKHGRWLKSEKTRGGRVDYAGIPLACDSQSCHPESAAKWSDRDRNQSSAAKDLVKHGFDARPCMLSPKGYPVNPYLLDSISLMHQLMRENRLLIHGTRAKQLLKALENQQVRADGKPEKVSSTASDRLSSPIDALRYLCWALFAPKAKPATIVAL